MKKDEKLGYVCFVVQRFERLNCKYCLYLCLYLLLFKGFFLFGFLIFQFKNTHTLLCLSREKTKGQSGKNATLTLTKTLPKKQDNNFINFQINLFTYKLYFQNKNYIYKKNKKTQKFFSIK